ncbi:MAG: hypothetical protein IKH57_21205 [Clostridia bacterium]|nr:hypothetical protein [Clostridia bacterium]
MITNISMEISEIRKADGTIIGVPCVRKSDGKSGIYNIETNEFVVINTANKEE